MLLLTGSQGRDQRQLYEHVGRREKGAHSVKWDGGPAQGQIELMKQGTNGTGKKTLAEPVQNWKTLMGPTKNKH